MTGSSLRRSAPRSGTRAVRRSAFGASVLLVVVAGLVGRHVARLEAKSAMKAPAPTAPAEPAVPTFDVNSLPPAK